MVYDARLALVLLPKGNLGTQIGEILQNWHGLGVISEGLLIPLENNEEGALEEFRVNAFPISKYRTGSSVPLFDYMGMKAYKTRELVAPWLLKDQTPDIALASYAHRLAKKIRNTLSQSGHSDQLHSHFCSTLLSVTAIGAVQEGDYVDNFVGYEDFTQNVYVSPEIQTVPGAGAIPVSSDMENFPQFIAAQIATVAGLWSGSPEPLSSMIATSDHVKTGNVIVLRGSVSAIMARDLANRIITSALTEAADPTVDPYSDARGNRPVSISDGQSIQNAIEINRDRIIAEDPDLLNWESQGEMQKIDFRFPLKARINHILEFIKTTFHDMVYWTKAYFGNRFSDAVGTLGPTLDLYPEPDYGLNKQILENFKKIKRAEEDVEGIESVAAANIAWEQRAGLWKRIRAIVFSSLDTAAILKSETKTDNSSETNTVSNHQLDFENHDFDVARSEKVSSATDASRVLPHVDYATSNPDNVFLVPQAIAAYLEIKEEFNFQEARDLKIVVQDSLRKLDEKLENARSAYEAKELEILELQELEDANEDGEEDEFLLEDKIDEESFESSQWEDEGDAEEDAEDEADLPSSSPPETLSETPADDVGHEEAPTTSENVKVRKNRKKVEIDTKLSKIEQTEKSIVAPKEVRSRKKSVDSANVVDADTSPPKKAVRTRTAKEVRGKDVE